MHNERVVCGPLLGGEDGADSLGRARVGAEAVDGFGWESDGVEGRSEGVGGLEEVLR